MTDTTVYLSRRIDPLAAEWHTPYGINESAVWLAWTNDDDPSELLAYQYILDDVVHNVARENVRDHFVPGDIFHYYTINSFG